MSDIKQTIIFNSGINSDTDKRFVKSGSSDYRLNCDITIIGEQGIIINSLGNLNINITLPLGNNEVIGKVEDLENNAIIYFVWNQEGHHCILRYNYQDKTFNKILWDRPDLNFDNTKPINCQIINGTIYWVDGINPNRNLNIQKAINYTEKPGITFYGNMDKAPENKLICQCDTSQFSIGDIIYINPNGIYDGFYKVIEIWDNGIAVYYYLNGNSISGSFIKIDGDCYLHIQESELSLIKERPNRRPIAYSYNDPKITSNFVIGNYFKFCSKYIYKDNTESVWSPISELVVPQFGNVTSSTLEKELSFEAISGTTRTWTCLSIYTKTKDVYACEGYNIRKNSSGTGDLNIYNLNTSVGTLRQVLTGISINNSNGDIWVCARDGYVLKQTSGTGEFSVVTQFPKDYYTGISVNSKTGDVYVCRWYGDVLKLINGENSTTILGGGNKIWAGVCINENNGYVYAIEQPYDYAINRPFDSTTNSTLYIKRGDANTFEVLYQKNAELFTSICINQDNNSVFLSSVHNDLITFAQTNYIYEQLSGFGSFVEVGTSNYGVSGMVVSNNYLFISCFRLDEEYATNPNNVYSSPLRDSISSSLQSADNAIKIAIDKGTEEVKYIKLAFNANGDSLGWFTINKYERTSPTDLLYVSFYNNENYESVTLSEIEKGFDNIPIYSKDLSLLPNTYLGLAGNQMYEDLVSLSITATQENNINKNLNRFLKGKTLIYTQIASITDNVTSQNGNEYEVNRIGDIDWIAISQNINKYITITIYNNDNIFIFEKSAYINTLSISNIKEFISLELKDFGTLNGSGQFIFNKTINNNIYSNLNLKIEIYSDSSNSDTENSTSTFYGLGKFGIVYYDKYGRNTGIKTNDNLLVKFTDSYTANGVNPNVIKLQITNKAPLSSKYFQIYYTGNINIASIWSGYYQINSDKLGTYFVKSERDVYSYELNDYSEFTTDEDGNKINNSYLIKGQLDDTNLQKVYIDASINSFSKYVYLIKIIRPLKGSNTIYYESSPIFDVENGNHIGNIQAQSVNTACVVKLNKGDFYSIQSKYNLKYISILSASTLYASNYWGNGRISVPIEQTNGGFLNNVLISNKYTPNTQQNGLSTFDWQNSSNELNQKYGEIYKSQLVGDVLKVFQREKITSFYTGKDISQTSNTEFIILTDQVLGRGRESEYNYGTIFPESVVSNNRNIYYYDLYNKCIVRDAANGQEDISTKYSIALIITEISDLILKEKDIHGRYKVVSFFDYITNMLYFTFVDRKNQNNLTLGFLEEANQWISFYSYIPEMYAGSNNMITFKNGQLWEHTESANRCEYYGINYNQVLKVIFNEKPLTIKVADSIILATNNRWKIESNIDANYTYKNGQYSVILPNQLINKEGKFYSDFFRNMKSFQPTIKKDQLYNGDKLRGEVMELTLTNSGNSEVYISNIDIKGSTSIGTNV